MGCVGPEFDSRRSHCIFRDAMHERRRAAARRRESLASREGSDPESRARLSSTLGGPTEILSDLVHERCRAVARRRELDRSERVKATPRVERGRVRLSAVPLFAERKWEPGRLADARLPAVARATGGSERGLGASKTCRRFHFLFYSPPPLFSALFSSKSSRTTLLSATRYRRGDVFGTSSISSTSIRRSV